MLRIIDITRPWARKDGANQQIRGIWLEYRLQNEHAQDVAKRQHSVSDLKISSVRNKCFDANQEWDFLMALPPTWIESLVQQLSYCLFPTELPSPLGCHYHFEMGCWEIALFPPLRQEQAEDEFHPAPCRPSRFTFDLKQATSLFEELQHIDWVAMPIDQENEVGPHLLLEGIVNNQPVLIRICSEVPARFQNELDLIVQEK